MYLKQALYAVISAVSFISVFYSVGKFMIFTSVPFKTSNTQNESVFWALLVNMFLLSLFMFQHTFMILPTCKRLFEKFNLNIVSRSVYNLVTSVLILVLIKYWNIIPEVLIWNVDMNKNGIWFIFGAIHLFAWSVFYAGCLFMDIAEILGIKQVYYSLRRMPDPMEFKSRELQRLYGHVRHPSFSAFVVVFWAYPIMSLDRFLFASVLTAYMYIAWKTDKYDLHYQQKQYRRKTEELSHLN